MQIPEDSPPPPAAAINNGIEVIGPEVIVQRVAPLLGVEDDMKQEADWSNRLSGELSHLVDDAAASIGQSREQVYSGVDALIRARSRRNPDRPHFSIQAIVDTLYNDQSKRFVGRMSELFREVVSAYVKFAEADAASSAAMAASSASSASAASSTSINMLSKLFGLTESGSSTPLPTPSSISTSQSTSSSIETSPTTSAESSTSATPASSSLVQTSTSAVGSTNSPAVSATGGTKHTNTKSRSKTSTSSSDGNDEDDDDDDDEDDDDEDGEDSSGGRPKVTTKKGP
ncbi:hypothetical protein IWW38_001876 [Coemansia aciculifera]|uniref:Uncharacterized protein n=1 Tax=Coemansia aciculifera TaxID=417176 RepID=A0ACC1M6T6_9FUNG|nr:hypothetical protein IWW38_001876 [Coemansia aciculifera]